MTQKNNNFDSQILIPIDKRMKDAIAVVAKHEQRSMTAQARYFIHQSLYLIADKKKLSDLELEENTNPTVYTDSSL